MFVALGLTIQIGSLGRAERLAGPGSCSPSCSRSSARPAVVYLLLLPVRLRLGERLFVMWGGLKGAVPILLGTLIVLSGIDGADRLYGIVFLVVAFSVVVQGGSVPWAARRLGVPMRLQEPEPWNISIGLRTEPDDLQRFVVAPGSRAEGDAIRELPIGDRAWVSLVIREGAARQARGSLVLEPPATRCSCSATPDDERKLRRRLRGVIGAPAAALSRTVTTRVVPSSSILV